MGMELRVRFRDGMEPSWEAVRDLLARAGYAVLMRMIDGQLAFPDEQPSASWDELRVATPQGMVTLRRQGHDIMCVTWGNADAGLQQAFHALAWAFAQAGDGQVQTAEGALDAAHFREQAELPEVLRGR